MRRSNIDIHCSLLLKWEQYARLSNCKRFLIFRSKFSTLPRKISAYLRTGSSSGANTRNIRGLHNVLNVSSLCLKDVLSFCKKHHFGLRNGPYQGLKSTISHPKMGLIGLRNGHYQNAILIFSDYVIGYMKTRYGMKRPS